jgi:hypothetical protein
VPLRRSTMRMRSCALAFYGVGVSPSGKAAGFDPAIRRFESCHPSQLCQEPLLFGSKGLG